MITFFSERAPIPRQQVYEVTPDGKLGAEVGGSRMVRDGIVREIEMAVMMDLPTAKLIHGWLGTTIATVKNRPLPKKRGRNRVPDLILKRNVRTTATGTTKGPSVTPASVATMGHGLYGSFSRGAWLGFETVGYPAELQFGVRNDALFQPDGYSVARQGSMRSPLPEAYRQLQQVDSGTSSIACSEPPNETAKWAARRLLDQLDETHPIPTRVLPSVDGGVAVIFVQATQYAEVEFYNSGEIIVTLRNATTRPDIFPAHATSLKRTLDRIGAHLR